MTTIPVRGEARLPECLGNVYIYAPGNYGQRRTLYSLQVPKLIGQQRRGGDGRIVVAGLSLLRRIPVTGKSVGAAGELTVTMAAAKQNLQCLTRVTSRVWPRCGEHSKSSRWSAVRR